MSAALFLRSLLCTSALISALGMPAAMALTPTEQAPARPLIHKVSGFLPDLKFTLQGPDDTLVTEDALAGKVVMMFFGYANCPDICPTTMGQLSMVMQKLGDDARNARILFVSVDPHRDTPEQLQAYVSMFDAHAMGLSGTEKQIANVARRYRVAYQIEKPQGDDPERYEVTHARGIYIFDQQGKARLLASDASSVGELAENVKALMRP